MKFICPKCNKEIIVDVPQNKANHIRWCGNEKVIKNGIYKWEQFQEKYNELRSWTKVAKYFHKSKKVMEMGIKNGFLISHKPFHTKETKEHLSDIRKQYLKNNPNKHFWKNNSKFISKPCEYFKQILANNNILYVAEYQPLEDRFFSIDIAIPTKKIGIEINGNQHYNNDGSLKEYYLNRHNLIENNGWTLYEIPYIKVYDNDFIKKFIDEIKQLMLG